MSCDGRVVRRAAAQNGLDTFDDEIQDHVAHCLRCQAEITRYRRMHRMLGNLRADNLVPGAGLLGDILAVLDDPHAHNPETKRSRRVLIAIVAGTLVGVAATLLLVNVRNHRQRH